MKPFRKQDQLACCSVSCILIAVLWSSIIWPALQSMIPQFGESEFDYNAGQLIADAIVSGQLAPDSYGQVRLPTKYTLPATYPHAIQSRVVYATTKPGNLQIIYFRTWRGIDRHRGYIYCTRRLAPHDMEKQGKVLGGKILCNTFGGTIISSVSVIGETHKNWYHVER